ncbi:hypothetical protein EDB83DRAFT_2243111, partial [Lactarius deliciosus]
VDNITYLLLGNATDVNTTAKLINTVISPTQTKLTAEAGPMQINLTFLNPIEPQNWVLQSIPFSYITLTAESLDGVAHATQVYSGLSADWWPGNQTQATIEVPMAMSNVYYHKIYSQSSLGALYYATKVPWQGHLVYTDIKYKIAEDSVSLDFFRLNGVLDDQTVDRGPVALNSTVFAISHDLGSIQTWQDPDPVIWAIGYDTDLVINYTDLSGAPPQQRRLFYKSQYLYSQILIDDFVNEFANASSRAQVLDLKILQYAQEYAAPISGLLGNLVSFATAQVYGSIHLTVAADANGYFNKSDVMALMRSFGGRVNAIEMLYSAFLAFMCIDPPLGGLLLESLFRPQASQKYTNPYAAADLGMDYPDVTLTNSPHNQGVEQSGNMLIMTYAHARASAKSRKILICLVCLFHG